MRPLPPNHSEPESKRDMWILANAELAWDACRYLTDAMSPTEIDRFEHRLGRDQIAREALAAAVDQLGAIQIVARDTETSLAPISRRWLRRSRRQIPVGGMVAAALILVVAGVAYRPSQQRSVENPTDVALAWTDLRDQTPSGDLAPVVNDPLAASAFGDEAGSGFDDVPAEQPLPSWMLAVVGPAPDSSEVTPSEGQ